MFVTIGQRLKQHMRHARQALRLWSRRRWLLAAVFSALIAVALGIVTVLIPNPIFHRDIPPTAWSYPVLIVTAVLSGMLMATYVKEPVPGATSGVSARLSGQEGLTDASSSSMPTPIGTKGEGAEGSSVVGMIGTFGAWFAIGCPVCNKLALLALGYSGAMTYFAPMQPWLAGISVVLLAVGLVVRLSGEIACVMPARAQG